MDTAPPISQSGGQMSATLMHKAGGGYITQSSGVIFCAPHSWPKSHGVQLVQPREFGHGQRMWITSWITKEICSSSQIPATCRACAMPVTRPRRPGAAEISAEKKKNKIANDGDAWARARALTQARRSLQPSPRHLKFWQGGKSPRGDPPHTIFSPSGARERRKRHAGTETAD